MKFISRDYIPLLLLMHDDNDYIHAQPSHILLFRFHCTHERMKETHFRLKSSSVESHFIVQIFLLMHNRSHNFFYLQIVSIIIIFMV